MVERRVRSQHAQNSIRDILKLVFAKTRTSFGYTSGSSGNVWAET